MGPRPPCHAPLRSSLHLGASHYAYPLVCGWVTPLSTLALVSWGPCLFSDLLVSRCSPGVGGLPSLPVLGGLVRGVCPGSASPGSRPWLPPSCFLWPSLPALPQGGGTPRSPGSRWDSQTQSDPSRFRLRRSEACGPSGDGSSWCESINPNKLATPRRRQGVFQLKHCNLGQQERWGIRLAAGK